MYNCNAKNNQYPIVFNSTTTQKLHRHYSDAYGQKLVFARLPGKSEEEQGCLVIYFWISCTPVNRHLPNEVPFNENALSMHMRECVSLRKLEHKRNANTYQHTNKCCKNRWDQRKHMSRKVFVPPKTLVLKICPASKEKARSEGPSPLGRARAVCFASEGSVHHFRFWDHSHGALITF